MLSPFEPVPPAAGHSARMPPVLMLAGVLGQLVLAPLLAWIYDCRTERHILTDTATCLRLGLPPLVLALLFGRWGALLPLFLRPAGRLVLFRLDDDRRGASVRFAVDRYRSALYVGALATVGMAVADAQHGHAVLAVAVLLAACHVAEIVGLANAVRAERAVVAAAACEEP